VEFGWWRDSVQGVTLGMRRADVGRAAEQRKMRRRKMRQQRMRKGWRTCG
jgi:hypothetical protein